VDYCGLLWTIVDYCGLLWAAVNCCGMIWTDVDCFLMLWKLMSSERYIKVVYMYNYCSVDEFYT
jgi:hypothetical protein